MRRRGVVGPRFRRRSRLQADPAITAAGATAPHRNQVQITHVDSQKVTKRRRGRAVTRPTPRRNGAVTFGLFASGDGESKGPHLTSSGELEAQTLSAAIGRRSLLRAASALAAAGVVGPAVLAGSADAAPTAARPPGTFPVLQPGVGRTRGTYLRSTPSTVSWGELPNRTSKPAVVLPSGGILTLDGVSHEGILEDQGKNPVAYFGSKGVPRRQVLNDAVDIAAHKPHTGPGPHIVTGPVAVKGAHKGDVLKIETLDLALRVPYGVISNRHGLGALPGEYPEKFAGVEGARGSGSIRSEKAGTDCAARLHSRQGKRTMDPPGALSLRK